MVIDGTGLPRRRADVAVKAGKIAKIGRVNGAGSAQEIDATGMFVAPGIVDAHTHYDPQITFDPFAMMSCFHGVTTVLAGNCGFSTAPCRAEDREFLQGVFASVEDMDPSALGGVRWEECESFPAFMQARKGKLGVNFACYVGHSNIRRWVMGDDAIKRAATPDEIEKMRVLVGEAMEAGAAGFSSSAAPTHNDIEGRPVPSRLSSREELLALMQEAGRFGSGSICYLPYSAIGGLTAEDQELLIEIGHASGLPVIIQGIGGRNKTDAPTATWEASVQFLDRATAEGAPVYSLLIARPFDRAVAFDDTNFLYAGVPTWHELFRLPIEERRARAKDPKAREALRFAVENPNKDPDKGTTLPPPPWQMVFVESSENLPESVHRGRSIAELAKEKGVTPGDFALDLALADDFTTKLRWRMDNPVWSDAVATAQLDPRIIVGVSDGGAHLAKDDQADWSSYFLRTWVLDRKVWTLEEGIRQITQVPASLLGFHDRGQLKVGGWADIMIFDPETIGPWRKEFVKDMLPGGAGRYRALGHGVKATIVNGQPIVLDGKLTGNLPGAVVAPL
jgi:N-acyl-D-aspartate/D-glutamate deacylase